MARDIKAGSAFVELTTKDSKFQKGLRSASRQLKQFGSQIAGVGKAMVGVGAALAAPLLLSVRQFTKLGDSLQKAAIRTGLTTEALSELNFAAEQSGASAEVLEKGVKTMQRSIVDLGRGLSTQKSAFGVLGLAFEDLKGLAPEQQLGLIADRLAGVSDPTVRAAVAMQLLGRSGQQLIPLLSQGSAGMDELRQQARDLGLTVGGDAANSAADLTDAMNELKRSLLAVAFTAGGALAPTITSTARGLSSAAASTREFVAENERGVRGVAKLSGLVGGLGVVFLGFSAAVAVVGSALGVLGAGPLAVVAVALGTIPLAMAGVVAAFNDGKVAGVDLGQAWLKLADDIGLLRLVMRDTSDAIRLEEAAEKLRRTSERVAEAEANLNNAGTDFEKLNAQREIVSALEAQLKAREQLSKAEAEGGRGTVQIAAAAKLEERIAEEQEKANALASTVATEIDDIEFEVAGTFKFGEVRTGPAFNSFTDRIRTFYDNAVAAGRKIQADAAQKLEAFNVQLELFNATEEDAIRINIDQQAERLKQQARELNQLTPAVAAEIDAKAAAQIESQLGDLQERLGQGLNIDLTSLGQFGGSLANLTLGFDQTLQQRTAVAAEQTAANTKEIANKVETTSAFFG